MPSPEINSLYEPIVTGTLFFFMASAILYTCFKKELEALQNRYITSMTRNTPLMSVLIFLAFYLCLGGKIAMFIAFVTAMHCVMALIIKKIYAWETRMQRKIGKRSG